MAGIPLDSSQPTFYMVSFRPVAIGLSLATTLGISACSRPAGDPADRRYAIQGSVVGSSLAGQQITIKHEAVEGLMPAMTMPFSVRGPQPSAQIDDRVTATLVVSDTSSWIEDIVIIRANPTPDAVVPATATLAAAVGKVMPNFRLTNHEGRDLTTNGYRGRVVVLTFIYTRCPLPDYCPRMMRHLDSVKRTLEREAELKSRVQLVGVSFDPVYDTPERLKAYGATYLTGADRFRGVDLATGEPQEVEALASFFGVRYFEEAGQISHSLATAIVGADGRVAAVFPSNTWTPDEALTVIRREVARAR